MQQGQTAGYTSLRMTLDRWALYILYSSLCDCCGCSLAARWVFNGLHTSVGRKSPDSTQVCSPVPSKACEEWSQHDEKENEIYLLLLLLRGAHEQREMTSETSVRPTRECDGATRCVWDANEPAGGVRWGGEQLIQSNTTLFVEYFKKNPVDQKCCTEE